MKSKRFTKKESHYDVELNLAPFLDILSVCICFLLTTAVWFSVSAIPMNKGTSTGSTSSAPCALRIQLISANDISIAVSGGTKERIALAALKDKLANSSLTPESCAVILSEKNAPYAAMITVTDELRRRGLTRISLTRNPAGGAL